MTQPEGKRSPSPAAKAEPVADFAAAAPIEKEEDDNTFKVFVGNLPFKAGDDEMKEFFGQCGEVLVSRVITRFGRSKGYGFVGYATEAEALKACELDKVEMMGRPINVQIARPRILNSERPPKPARAPRDPANKPERPPRAARPPRAPKGEPEGEESPDMLYIGNLPFKVTDDELKEIFSSYNVVSARVVALKSGRSKGFGFVQVVDHAEQQKIMSELQDVNVNGRQLSIKVAKASQTPHAEKKAEDAE